MKSQTISETTPHHNFLYRYFKHWWDTIEYIQEHGWKEYRKARERYDKHQETIKNIQSRYTKKGEIKMANRMSKTRK
ncbi:MAG: hypothetical protein WC455_24000 [Dehalococcoidia bacterium]|jgi:membrane-bound lytic murein transglycosylase B